MEATASEGPIGRMEALAKTRNISWEKLMEGYREIWEIKKTKERALLEELAAAFQLPIFRTRLKLLNSKERVILTREISPEEVQEMALKELTEAYCCYGRTISPELRRALSLKEIAEPYQIKRAITMVEGLKETVEFYHSTDYTEEIDTEIHYLRRSISKGSQDNAPKAAVRMTDPSERDLSHPTLMNQLHLEYHNSGHDGYAQPFTSANDAPSDPNFSRQSPENEYVVIEIGHDQILGRSKCKNPTSFSKNHGNDSLTYSSIEPLNASYGLETNRMFVSILGQAAAGVMTSASVKNSSVLMFLYIAALVGFLGNLWAMYLQKNQMWAKWLSKIGAIGSSCGILVALSSNFAVEEYLTAYRVITAAGVVITTVLITMDN